MIGMNSFINQYPRLKKYGFHKAATLPQLRNAHRLASKKENKNNLNNVFQHYVAKMGYTEMTPRYENIPPVTRPVIPPPTPQSATLPQWPPKNLPVSLQRGTLSRSGFESVLKRRLLPKSWRVGKKPPRPGFESAPIPQLFRAQAHAGNKMLSPRINTPMLSRQSSIASNYGSARSVLSRSGSLASLPNVSRTAVDDPTTVYLTNLVKIVKHHYPSLKNNDEAFEYVKNTLAKRIARNMVWDRRRQTVVNVSKRAKNKTVKGFAAVGKGATAAAQGLWTGITAAGAGVRNGAKATGTGLGTMWTGMTTRAKTMLNARRQQKLNRMLNILQRSGYSFTPPASAVTTPGNSRRNSINSRR